MTHTTRTLALAIAASSVLGGMIGALATDATQSQAITPAAIAAAVQKVQDTSAESTLAAMLKGQSFGSSTIGYDLFQICENTRPENPTAGSC